MSACGGSSDPGGFTPVDPATPTTPTSDTELKPAHLVALNTYSASVGTLIEAYGTSFPTPDRGQTYLVFNGTFTDINGAEEAVNLEVPTDRVDPSTVRWTSFGPYRNPLSASGNRAGRFTGHMSARIVTTEGKILDDPERTPVNFDVKPSILIHELQPITATCNGAVKRALGGAAYRLRVEAIGFDPVSFTYSLSAPAVELAPIVVRNIAQGRFDSVGDQGNFRVPMVPNGVQSYSTLVTVTAVDANDNVVQNSFAIAVHRPLEVFYNGNVDVAEVLPAVPVSGCMPGGEAGRAVSYNESRQETRSKTYDMRWNEQWLNSHTVTAGSQQTIGLSETNGVGFSTSNGQSFNWSLGTEVNGSFSIADLVSAGMSVSGSVGGETTMSQTQSANRSQGVNASTTTTETESASQSRGGSVGGGFSWQASSSETISRGFGGTVIAKTYGVFYRQTLRLLRKAAVVTYNQCGAATVVADLDFNDWTWSADLALGAQCPPLPESNLPPAQCNISPCSGQ